MVVKELNYVYWMELKELNPYIGGSKGIELCILVGIKGVKSCILVVVKELNYVYWMELKELNPVYWCYFFRTF